MPDYVRARVPREGTYDLSRTTSRQRATAAGWELLDEPTHTADGRIRPDSRLNGREAKPQTSVAQKAAEKKAASSAATDSKPSEKE